MPERPGRPTFFAAVHALVAQVPRGRVVTYGQVAVLLGAPGAARAVGYALHALDGSEGVPWWRVINARGGVSLRGRGAVADLQRAFLEAEGVVFDGEGRTELRCFRWWPGEG
ncbi:MAG: MGMT family protein [Dehalococcoidia bacterium]|nr:MGMT family protein [Dehalococcoidia bacterium]